MDPAEYEKAWPGRRSKIREDDKSDALCAVGMCVCVFGCSVYVCV